MAVGTGMAIGLGLGGLGAGYMSSRAQSRAAGKARGMTRKMMKMYMPWRDVGMDALSKLQNFQFDESDPAYQWRLGEGQKSIDAFLASRGLYNSRAGMNALTDFTSKLGAEEYGNQYGRAFNLAQMGLGATQGATGVGQNLPNIAMQEGQQQSDFWAGLPGLASSALMGGYYGGQLFGGSPGVGGGTSSIGGGLGYGV